jgi:hypothetical protein
MGREQKPWFFPAVCEVMSAEIAAIGGLDGQRAKTTFFARGLRSDVR